MNQSIRDPKVLYGKTIWRDYRHKIHRKERLKNKVNIPEDHEIMKELERYHANYIINNLIRDFKKIERELGSKIVIFT